MKNFGKREELMKMNFRITEGGYILDVSDVENSYILTPEGERSSDIRGSQCMA